MLKARDGPIHHTLFFNVYLFILIERKQMGEGQSKRERENQPGSTLSAEPNTWLNFMTVSEIMA